MAHELPALLIVEDDSAAARQLRWTFDEYDVTLAGDRQEAVAALKSRSYPVVLLDLGLPPDPDGISEGLASLREIVTLAPHSRVIVVTGQNEHENALAAIRLGAHDFYVKPIDADELRLLTRRNADLHALDLENRRRASALGEEGGLPGVVSASDAMRAVEGLIGRAARTDIGVMLLGESGVGKEVIARALHALSARAAAPFVAINCGAIPETLLESELFGYEKGAFTGADKSRLGHIQAAAGGTLLLDEIGDMPLALQAKLLRFLQERVIKRVGGRREIPVDVRVISATHRDPEAMVADGTFREDLFYRLRELSVTIPPLRERPEDIPVLAEHFCRRYSEERQQGDAMLTSQAIAAAASHPWPGNVRELENRVKRAVLMAEGNRIGPQDLELGSADPIATARLSDAVSEAEEAAVRRAWAQSGGNVSKAAQLLGVSRPTAYKLLRGYGLRA